MNATLRSRGRFITVEGSEGAGKSTNLGAVVGALQERGIDVDVTREPGGTDLAEELRGVLLAHRDEEMDSLTELLLMFAARAQHLARRIRPALERGTWVVCDRFTDATFAYQGGGRQLGHEATAVLAKLVHGDLWPDLTLYLDIDPERGLARAGDRSRPDRFESEQLAFFRRVREAYQARAMAEPDRIVVIDADRSLEEVRSDVRMRLDHWCDALDAKEGAGG